MYIAPFLTVLPPLLYKNKRQSKNLNEGIIDKIIYPQHPVAKDDQLM